jgi:hypothetical protein
MEITNLTLFGFPIMTLLAIWGVGYMIRTGLKDWGEQRALIKSGSAKMGYLITMIIKM